MILTQLKQMNHMMIIHRGYNNSNFQSSEHSSLDYSISSHFLVSVYQTLPSITLVSISRDGFLLVVVVFPGHYYQSHKAF